MLSQKMRKILLEVVLLLIILIVLLWIYNRDVRSLEKEIYSCNKYIESLGSFHVNNYLVFKEDNSHLASREFKGIDETDFTFNYSIK